MRRKINLKRAAFDAWRQVVEVMIVGCSNELVPSRQTLLVELTQAILAKSRDGQPLSTLLSPASGCVVLLIQQLRFTTHVPNSDVTLLVSILFIYFLELLHDAIFRFPMAPYSLTVASNPKSSNHTHREGADTFFMAPNTP